MNSVPDTCPPLEDIAAFLDGMLSEEERARVVAHLADCESCYTVFAGAARFQLEEKAEPLEPVAAVAATPAPVIPLQRKTSRRWALPLAALLVLGLASIPIYRQYTWVPQLLATELVNPAALESVPTSSLWAEDKRGGGSTSAIDTAPAELLVGAHLVDLRLVLARGDREETMNVLARINGLTGDLLFVGEQAAFYRKAVGDLSEGRTTLEEVARGAARTEVELTELYSESPYLAFGKWAEAGRLSALAGSPAFFQDGDNRRFPGWLLRTAEEELDPGVVRVVKRVRDIVRGSDPEELPYDDLAEQLDAVLRHYQREADAASSP